ncbi:hypothetical protein K1719_004925 [Acacia pycnantha]|nr:hypothetical protein K1719_004925 [Acacia pycnantha]
MEDIQISSPLVWKELDSENILVGKILTNKPFMKNEIELILCKAWNLEDDFNVIKISGNAFMFKFAKRKPLACRFWMPKLDDRKVWISVRYEKLQSYCYNCGRIGHDNKICKSERAMSLAHPSEPRFGAWLTTNSYRNWDEVMIVVKDEWAEADDARKKREEALRRKRTEDRKQGNSTSHPFEDDLFYIKVNKSFTESEMDEPLRCHSKGKVEDVGAVKAKESPLNVVAEQEAGLKGSCGLANKPVAPEEVHPLAMVVYSGQILTEMINGIECLGLKRKAVDEGDKVGQKRRKLAIVEANSAKDIFDYAACLRKTKARVRRNDKCRRKKDKENLVEEVMDYDENMGDAADLKAPGSEFIFRAKVGSDHHALIIVCWFCEDKFPKYFKFEAAWAQHEDFLKIVGEGWNDVEGNLNNRLNDLIRRLEACRKWIVRWSRTEFPNFKNVIKQLRYRLHTCYEGQMSSASLKEAEDLVKQLEEAWDRE